MERSALLSRPGTNMREAATQAQRLRDHMQGAYLGPAFSDQAIRTRLDAVGASYEVLTDDEVISRTAALLAKERRSAGCRGGWNSARERWGRVRFLGILAPRRCRKH